MKERFSLITNSPEAYSMFAKFTNSFQVCVVAVVFLIVTFVSSKKIPSSFRNDQIYAVNAIPEDTSDIFTEAPEISNHIPKIPIKFEKKYGDVTKNEIKNYFAEKYGGKAARSRTLKDSNIQKYLNERFTKSLHEDQIKKILSWLTDDMLIFKNVDTDNNGFITWNEYIDNLDLSPKDVNILMESYDKDGDKRVSTEEFMRVKRWTGERTKGKTKKRGKCNIQKIHKCGITLLRNTYRNNKIACISFKEYMQCIADKIQRCRKRQIFSVVAIFVHVLHKLQGKVTCTIPDLPRVPMMRRELPVPKELVLPANSACIPATVMWCSTGLYLEIARRPNSRGCAIIKQYKGCLHTATLKCKKRATKHIRRSYIAVKKACYRTKKKKIRV